MIDIHSHVLPGLDDGARSLEESIAMVRMAAAHGTTDLVATPHANMDFHFDEERVERKLAELRRATEGVLRLHRGCDFHLYFDNIQDALAHSTRYSINGKCYLLVECPDLLVGRGTDQVFDRLLQSGLIPVITHPERNYLLHTRMADLERWVKQGTLVQVTGQSLLGRFGTDVRAIARELFRRGLVHFIASDAHDTRDRTTRLDEAYAWVKSHYGERRAELLFVENPGAAIAGTPLGPQPPPEPPRKWWQFRRLL